MPAHAAPSHVPRDTPEDDPQQQRCCCCCYRWLSGGGCSNSCESTSGWARHVRVVDGGGVCVRALLRPGGWRSHLRSRGGSGRLRGVANQLREPRDTHTCHTNHWTTYFTRAVVAPVCCAVQTSPRSQRRTFFLASATPFIFPIVVPTYSTSTMQWWQQLRATTAF
jgi:hypothetical protein